MKLDELFHYIVNNSWIRNGTVVISVPEDVDAEVFYDEFLKALGGTE